MATQTSFVPGYKTSNLLVSEEKIFKMSAYQSYVFCHNQSTEIFTTILQTSFVPRQGIILFYSYQSETGLFMVAMFYVKTGWKDLIKMVCAKSGFTWPR